jgi:hypothetical protein
MGESGATDSQEIRSPLQLRLGPNPERHSVSPATGLLFSAAALRGPKAQTSSLSEHNSLLYGSLYAAL